MPVYVIHNTAAVAGYVFLQDYIHWFLNLLQVIVRSTFSIVCWYYWTCVLSLLYLNGPKVFLGKVFGVMGVQQWKIPSPKNNIQKITNQ